MKQSRVRLKMALKVKKRKKNLIHSMKMVNCTSEKAKLRKFSSGLRICTSTRLKATLELQNMFKRTRLSRNSNLSQKFLRKLLRWLRTKERSCSEIKKSLWLKSFLDHLQTTLNGEKKSFKLWLRKKLKNALSSPKLWIIQSTKKLVVTRTLISTKRLRRDNMQTRKLLQLMSMNKENAPDEYTFKPNFIKETKARHTATNSIPGFDKVLERQKKAREEQRLKKLGTERGIPAQMIKKMKQEMPDRTLITTNIHKKFGKTFGVDSA